MTSYVKIYGSQLLRSTVWVNSTKETKLVWITLLAIADQHGLALTSIPGLARDAGVTNEECEQALSVLESPDPYSRTKKYEGRRVEPIDGGFLLLNYKKYRELRTEAQVRGAEKKAAWRAKQKDKSRPSDDTGDMSEDIPVSDTTPTPSPAPTPELRSTASSISLVPTREHPLTAQSVLSTLEQLTEQSDIQKTLRTWQIRAIFAYWVKVMKKDNKRVLLSKDRWVRIDKYLRLYQIEACLYAIDGALTHPDLNHESGRSYHELEQIFLKGSDGPGRVEKLSDYAERRHRKRKHRLLKAHPQIEGKEPNGTTPGDDEGRDPRGPATADASVGGSGSEAKPGTSHQPRDGSASSDADSDGDDSGNADNEGSGSDRG